MKNMFFKTLKKQKKIEAGIFYKAINRYKNYVKNRKKFELYFFFENRRMQKNVEENRIKQKKIEAMNNTKLITQFRRNSLFNLIIRVSAIFGNFSFEI